MSLSARPVADFSAAGAGGNVRRVSCGPMLADKGLSAILLLRFHYVSAQAIVRTSAAVVSVDNALGVGSDAATSSLVYCSLRFLRRPLERTLRTILPLSTCG